MASIGTDASDPCYVFEQYLLAVQTRTARYGVDPNDMAKNIVGLVAAMADMVDHRIALAAAAAAAPPA